MPKPTIVPQCPSCSAPNARWQEFTSIINRHDTYQCLACGRVWHVKIAPPAP